MTLEEFSQTDFERALKRTIRSLTRGKMVSEEPQAILLGGQRGAGKTTIHRIKQKEFQGNIIIIDRDSYRSQHPNYIALQETYGKDSVAYTKQFTGKMVEYLVEELSKQGYRLLIAGTLRTMKVPRKTAQLLKSKDYQILLALIATTPELSYLSTMIRYEELYALDTSQARVTPIYQRDRSCIYDSEVDEGSAAEVLQDYLFGKWSKVEEEMMKVGQERLNELSWNLRH